MRWRTDPRRGEDLFLEVHGARVARLARDGRGYVAWIRYADVNVLGRFERLDAARRFIEGELWSAAGELVDAGDRFAAEPAAHRSKAARFHARLR